MRIRPITAAAGLLLALALTACGSSYTVADCQKALTDASTETNRPKECADLSQEDYKTVLMNKAIKDALGDMSQEDRDLLDYGDDGKLNDSVTGG